MDTDPDIAKLIIVYLSSWHNQQPSPIPYDIILPRMLQAQEAIFGRQLFEGWWHRDWEHLQELYYKSKLWDIA